MKLVTFVAEGKQLVGALDGDDVVVIDIPDMRSLFALGTPVQEYAEKLKTTRRYPLASVQLKAPIIPKKFFHTAGNYAEHAQEGDRQAAIKPWIVLRMSMRSSADAPVDPA
jgi:2-keto-4-pentenoate hydratase/2-oxohepta-3-ene-1,7-dioic acid hydratase in catechol pathway